MADFPRMGYWLLAIGCWLLAYARFHQIANIPTANR
jgi:hypothetical protein